MYWFDSAYEAVARFMDMGGDVLWLIAILLFLMWMLIFERAWYFYSGWKTDAALAIASWEARQERKSWQAKQIRRKLVAQAHDQINQYLPVIKTLVALCPLLGLLGTVTGMISVFEVMAISGTSNARSMAAGVSRATVPTMAGMVGALSGVFLVTILTRTAKRNTALLEDELTMDH